MDKKHFENCTPENPCSDCAKNIVCKNCGKVTKYIVCESCGHDNEKDHICDFEGAICKICGASTI